MSLDLPSHTSTSALAQIHTQRDVVLRFYHILHKHFFFFFFKYSWPAVSVFASLYLPPHLYY